jgi:hypothetical protein
MSPPSAPSIRSAVATFIRGGPAARPGWRTVRHGSAAPPPSGAVRGISRGLSPKWQRRRRGVPIIERRAVCFAP